VNKRQAKKRLDELNRAYERHYRSNQRHSANQIQKLLKGEDTTKVEELRDRARARLDEISRERKRIYRWRQDQAVMADVVGKRIDAMLAVARANRPRPETDKERKERERHAKAQAASHAKRTTTLASAAIEFDPRLATANRDLHVDALGANNRARSLTYKALFDRRASDATTTRVAACAAFDGLWHAAHAGDFPEPRFEPQVDTSGKERAHQEHRAGAKRKLEQLHRTIGREAYELLEQRIVHNVRYTTLAKIMAVGRNRLPTLFVEATDGLVEFFGLAGAPDRSRIRAYRSAEG
jgi:hypothetical protein